MREKYSKISIIVLSIIPLLITTFLLDKWILPQNESNELITGYSSITVRQGSRYNKSNEETVGTRFFTASGLKFSVQDILVEENEVTIGRSFIFGNITSVKSKINDYTDNLTSGLNGACLYFVVSLGITSIISLLLIKFQKKMSNNSFQNIILLNSFLMFLIAYALVLFG